VCHHSHHEIEKVAIMNLVVSFEESINRLNAAMSHATFLEAINEHWNPRPGHDGEALASSWCWLFCWGMTGNGSAIHKKAAQEVFNEVFPAINFRRYRVGGDFHKEAQEMRYRPGDEEEALRGLLSDHDEGKIT
jgi:hypothetical protein